MTEPPPRPLLAFYGDDFTGSTDAMEVLAANGLETLLFLRLPEPHELWAARERCAAIGIAGTSRAKDPAWMDRELPAVFDRLKETGARICHYKVCSTFDSSPTVGNIGRAIQIGRSRFGATMATPLVVGATALRRYTAFGHLFAAAGTDVWRIDRHPTMSQHPVTPMHEADLRMHLQRQAPLSVGLMDLVSLQRPDASARLDALLPQHDVVLFDVIDSASQAQVGRLIDAMAERDAAPLFCVGSSGIEYALVGHWAAQRPEQVHAAALNADPVDAIIVLSGSCSPTTARQIRHACDHGFADLRIDLTALLQDDRRDGELAHIEAAACAALHQKRSAVLYMACGPDDPAIAQLNDRIRSQGLPPRETLARLSQLLGTLLKHVIDRSGVTRVVIAGGDTSGEVVHALGLTALRMKARIAPGGPLCDAFNDLQAAPLLEIALKGGQIGGDDYFEQARAGRG